MQRRRRDERGKKGVARAVGVDELLLRERRHELEVEVAAVALEARPLDAQLCDGGMQRQCDRRTNDTAQPADQPMFESR